MQKLKGLKNLYCDPLASFVYEFAPRAEIDITLTEDEEKLLCEYAALKNKITGVSEVNLACNNPKNAVLALQKYGLKGRAVVSEIDAAQEGCILHIKDVLALSESGLTEFSQTLAQKKIPCLITFGRSLWEMGQIDKTYKVSPAQFLEDFGFLDRNCAILGANFLDKDDLEILSQYDAKIILSPRADMLMGRGFVNLAPLRSKGLELGFASEIHPVIDIIGEGLLAAGQTANLMYGSSVVGFDQLAKFIFSLPPPEENLELAAMLSPREMASEDEKKELGRLRGELHNLLKKL